MNLKTARGTRALLDLEDDAPDVLFERLPGSSVPLWPSVRTDFMVAMQCHDFGSDPVAALPEKAARMRAVYRLGRAFLPSRWDAGRLRSQRSAMHLVSGSTTYVVAGKFHNWLVGDFADQIPDASVILQWGSMGAVGPHFSLTRSLDPLVTRAAGYARLRGRSVDLDRVGLMVREFATRLDDRITRDQVEAIAASAAYSAATTPYVESQFSRVLDRVRPRLALMEDASYGSRGGLVALMKARGILVAEPQHGWVGPTHGAYNFGAAMREPELLATLPDELLTFGEYWSGGIRHPARSIAIGKPHLEAMSALASGWDERPREVLIVSSVTNPTGTIDFGLALRAALPADWTIRFRPHPSERATVRSRYARMLSGPGLALDDNSDVYASLATARAVVGVASTVLFEALAMGCRVFVQDSPFADYYVGDLFGPAIAGADGAERIARDLLDGAQVDASPTLDAMWKPGAAENFRSWAQSRLGVRG